MAETHDTKQPTAADDRPVSKGKSAMTDSDFVNPIISLKEPMPDDPNPDSVVHLGIYCDGQQCCERHEPIQGPRYHCSVCENVDLCSVCIRDPGHGHDTTHFFLECLMQSRFKRKHAMAEDERKATEDLAREGQVHDLSRRLAEIALQTGNVRESRRLLPGTDPNDHEPVFTQYRISEEGLEITDVPASARKPDDFVAEERVFLHPDMAMGHLTRELTLYPYGPDQFREDAMAGKMATRVIDLCPGTGDDILRCSLRSIRLGDDCNYEALSYTWKKTSYERAHVPHWDEQIQEAFKILVNGEHPVYVGEKHFVTVSPGLRDALLSYRHPKEVRTLWVDQICIDQNNLSERAFQVNLMSRIYNLASRVVVWTGHEDNDTNPAFELMEKLAPEIVSRQGRCLSPAELDAHTELDLPIVGTAPWESLLNFFKRPVFSRGWVIQEVVVAQDVFVRCGGHEIPFWKVAAVASWLAQPAWVSSEYYQSIVKQSVRG